MMKTCRDARIRDRRVGLEIYGEYDKNGDGIYRVKVCVRRNGAGRK